MGQEAVSPGPEVAHSLESPPSLFPWGSLGPPFQSGLLAGTADPVLFFLLVEAATFTDAVFPIHDLTFGVEEGEWRAATYAEVL